MKFLLLYCIGLSLVLVFLPAAIAGDCWVWEGEAGMPADLPGAPGETTAGEGTGADGGPSGDILLQIYVVQTGELKELELEDYVRGVIAAEMPASFHPEALKAQAVAARTYAWQRAGPDGGGCPNHPEAALCTASTCCQAWLEDEEARKKWPAAKADSYLERIAEAVRATRGQVLTYDGEPITAVYHSTCGGKTEAAAELWGESGTDYPYLQSVDCPYCQRSPSCRQELALELSAYAAALQDEKEARPVLAAGGDYPLLEIVRKSASGRNLLLRIGKPGRLYSGSEVRRLLGLPSTHFHWRVEGGKIIFSVRGNGHGVGMCQYGADGLARAGKTYAEILGHYYGGATLEKRTAKTSTPLERKPCR